MLEIKPTSKPPVILPIPGNNLIPIEIVKIYVTTSLHKMMMKSWETFREANAENKEKKGEEEKINERLARLPIIAEAMKSLAAKLKL